MKYKFVGEGSGVPGLPHEITDDEALERGITDLLKAAIANGNYKPDEETARTELKPKRAAQDKE